jgi:YrbI family 3-deoxy-D-manno-octulosonate 8-phosphate phosphatase
MKPDFSKIKLLVCDFDGVMTDDRVLVDQDGKEAVFCSRSDGLGIELLKKKGVPVVVISREQNPVVAARCNKLKIECYNGIDKKIDILRKIIGEHKVLPEEVCYVGNDVNDIDCVKACGIGVAVVDAHPDLIKVAGFVTKKKGGLGAVREICDKML